MKNQIVFTLFPSMKKRVESKNDYTGMSYKKVISGFKTSFALTPAKLEVYNDYMLWLGNKEREQEFYVYALRIQAEILKKNEDICKYLFESINIEYIKNFFIEFIHDSRYVIDIEGLLSVFKNTSQYNKDKNKYCLWLGHCFRTFIAELEHKPHVSSALFEHMQKLKFNDACCLYNFLLCCVSSSSEEINYDSNIATKLCKYLLVHGAELVQQELQQKLENQRLKKEEAARNEAGNVLRERNTRRANLPALSREILVDIGHWDLWEAESVTLPNGETAPLQTEWRGRNPTLDIHDDVFVAIDFGTTNTVVALLENGAPHLVPVGLRDWNATPQPADYENPTVLEMLDFQAFERAWRNDCHDPDITWSAVRCSHQAKAELHQSATWSMLRSGMSRLKMWARDKVRELPRTDQQGCDFVASLQGECASDPREDYATAPFDPIELYAYFLGLGINTQLSFGGRIYTNYIMSFPVKYDKETCARIRKSFARGLERSLPRSLGRQEEWRATSPLTLTEGPKEPVAFAAAALPQAHVDGSDSRVPLTAEGVLFGVFDFGGGTTDMTVGLYRLPTLEEEDTHGWESVLELLDNTGDIYLGGEQILHHMATRVVQDNLPLFLQRELPFNKPEDLPHFPGAERICSSSSAALSNTTKLCEALRPLWETGHMDSEDMGDVLALTLFNANGEDVPNVSLSIDTTALRALLTERVSHGFESFFNTVRQGARHCPRNDIYILLAGNACRSPLVKQAWESTCGRIFGEDDNWKRSIHLCALPGNDSLLSLKTGVALGLLRTAPGETAVGVVNHSQTTSGETVFRYSVGLFKHDVLVPALTRHMPYGEWRALGKVHSSCATRLGYTEAEAANAIEQQVRRGSCREMLLRWDKSDMGKAIWIRSTAPDCIELGLSDTPDTTPQNPAHTRTLQ